MFGWKKNHDNSRVKDAKKQADDACVRSKEVRNKVTERLREFEKSIDGSRHHGHTVG